MWGCANIPVEETQLETDDDSENSTTSTDSDESNEED